MHMGYDVHAWAVMSMCARAYAYECANASVGGVCACVVYAHVRIHNLHAAFDTCAYASDVHAEDAHAHACHMHVG